MRLTRIFTDVEQRLRMGLNTEETVDEEEVGLNDDLISSLYFTQDQQKRVDFILAYESPKPEDMEATSKSLKRFVFTENLLKEGLELEIEDSGGCALSFIKIHAPMELLKRYAEILKIRMPIRKFSAEMLACQEKRQGAEGVDMLEFKLTQIGGSRESTMDSIRIPLFSDVADGVKSWLERLQEPFYPDPDIMNNSKDRVSRRSYLAGWYKLGRDKEYLFDHDKVNFFSQSTRSRIIEFLLQRKRYSDNTADDFAFGISRLISERVFLAAYPLHDGTIKTPGSMRYLLYREWASIRKFWKYQPLDAVRDYFGVKIGLYFAWLGFYTFMLIPPSLVGLICFLYGLITMSTDTPSDDICPGGGMANTTMCPICDNFCEPWKLQDACHLSKAKYLFDNGTTVFFAVFMSLWAVFFLECWKRYSAEISHRWDVFGYDPEEEHPRPEYLVKLRNVKDKTVNFITQTSEPKPPFWKMKLPGILISWTSVYLLIFLAVAAVIAVILYRMSMVVALAAVHDSTIRGNWSLFISMTGAGINLVLILLFNWFYEQIAFWLTEKELRRTQTEFDDSLTLKIYLFQFVNYYFSIFYIAFIKGQYIGRPGAYIRFFGYRQEECSPGGCFMELCIQLGIIFFGKQFFMSILEYYMPLLWRLFNLIKLRHGTLSCLGGKDKQKEENTPQYVRDFKLVEWGHQGLFYEYLEMVIQYGFITIFVCAFPLAPLLAFLNNILEMRLDAKKLLILHRRPVAQKVRDIGIWFDILETLGRIAVITNAFIIAFTSEFIPKIVYRVHYSEDGSLKNYVNFTLSYFEQSDGDGNSTGLCRYQDYNLPPWDEFKYQRSLIFYHIMFAKLLFVVVFENVVAVTIMTVRLLIPDMSASLKYRIRREAYVTKEIIIRTERLKKEFKASSVPNIVSSTELSKPVSRGVSRQESLPHMASVTGSDLSPSSDALTVEFYKHKNSVDI
ncbi:anoctamin-1 isoform X4 [Eurytemora carolleeae]|uniref:anoctamin-1 isoform X4 n=1 Tax=Eurytemora carolleeae TaxID=1294199 RepID=UPI000C760223|nr:anoctamin-1 isoform X4 [Eurytemora carolleeae]|eukprot:XP_023339966.1 anoctamin-1-like isoform X4 [Eurytemora affinis]